MRQRIYIDTSVIGGYYDEKFEEPTKKLKLQEDVEIFKKTNTFSEYMTGFFVDICSISKKIKKQYCLLLKNFLFH